MPIFGRRLASRRLRRRSTRRRRRLETAARIARVFGIARAEACEVAAAVEIAGALGCCAQADVAAVLAIAKRASDVLSRLASR